MLSQLFTPSAVPQRSSLGRIVNQSTMLLMFSVGSLILLLALLILFHQNSIATKGYLLRNLERERFQFLLEEEVLNMQVAESQAIETLESDKQVQAMVIVRDALYVEEDSTVARSEDGE